MIEARDIVFAYPSAPFRLHLSELVVSRGETIALVGPSGCGKTTLLQLLAGVEIPQSGSLKVAGGEWAALSRAARQAHRLGKIGLVPQNFELLDYLTVRENILLPCRLGSALGAAREREERCDSLAERSGIEGHLSKYPGQLSQGERQRAALCRGLIGQPQLILADEPTGNLDPENQDRIVGLLLEEAGLIDATVVMVTHEPGLLPRFDRALDLRDLGRWEVAV
jgi:putative ABC transport system ATP-binding protein